MLIASGVTVAPPGGAAPVIEHLSLAVAPGECLAITGPNGSGKTTLALALAGLQSVRAGEVRFEGRPIGPGHDPAHRAGIATLLQDPSNQLLQPTVLDEVAFAAHNLGRADAGQRAGAWLERFGIGDLAGRDPRQLSAGQQQLVLLASALAQAPRLLVADEPVSHLDPGRTARAQAVLEDSGRAGLAIVWVGEHARATRTLALGPSRSDVAELPSSAEAGVEAEPPAAPAPTPADSAATLVLRIAALPSGSENGPRVVTNEPLEIAIPARGVTAWLGPNGVGKSVVLAAAAGVVRVDQIDVRWFGTPAMAPVLSPQYPEEQIFEEQAGDELIYGAIARGVPREVAQARARIALHLAGLGNETWTRRTWTLSGGEKRWLAVAATLITPAGLVLLDEPTAGLDDARRESVARLIFQFCREVPVLIATQDRLFADRLGAHKIELPGRSRVVLETPSPSKKTD